jgi:hypothetical protein
MGRRDGAKNFPGRRRVVVSVGFIAPIDAFDVDEGFVVVPLTAMIPRLAASEGLREGNLVGVLLLGDPRTFPASSVCYGLPVRVLLLALARGGVFRRNDVTERRARKCSRGEGRDRGDFVARKVDGALLRLRLRAEEVTELRLQGNCVDRRRAL